jgi:hypothetical protein
MLLPATGGTWAQLIQPGINPLNVRYGQIVDVFMRDYYNADGTVFNMADPKYGLGLVTLPDGNVTQLVTPFAADGISIRPDLLITSPGPNLGFYHFGDLKEDSLSITPDQTMQQTPSAQQRRSSRNVLSKLGDKISFEPQEETPLTRYVRWELPLRNVPAVGTPGLIIPRGQGDVTQERVIIALIVDTDGQLMARVLPRVVTDKKGKEDLGVKNPLAGSLDWDILGCPYSKQSQWVCYAGSQWNASGNFEFETYPPLAVPQTGGLTVTAQFPTPADMPSPVYTAHVEAADGTLSALNLTGSPVVSGKFTTLTGGGLTASTLYKGIQVTATDGEVGASSPLSNGFTTLAAAG